MNEEEFFWDWLKHENNILTSRGSFFLIAESVFFAIIAMNTSISATSIAPAWLFYVIGLLITLVWLLVNIKHIYGTHQYIGNKLRNVFVDHPWSKAYKERAKWPWKNHKLLGIYFPLLFFLVWFYLLISYLSKLKSLIS